MKIKRKKYQLQYVKLGLVSNVKGAGIEYVVKTEVFDSHKEYDCVIKRLIKFKGFENHGKILLNKSEQMKININKW